MWRLPANDRLRHRGPEMTRLLGPLVAGLVAVLALLGPSARPVAPDEPTAR